MRNSSRNTILLLRGVPKGGLGPKYAFRLKKFLP
jgi:hypothetical protein